MFVLLPFTNIHRKGGFIREKTTVVFGKTSDVSGKTLDVFGKTSDVFDGCFGWGNGRKKCAKKSEHEIWNNKSEEWSFFSFLKICNILIFNYLQSNLCVFAPKMYAISWFEPEKCMQLSNSNEVEPEKCMQLFNSNEAECKKCMQFSYKE